MKTLRRRIYRVLYCPWAGHFGLRVPVDPTMRQTSDAVIRCIDCHKKLPDTHLAIDFGVTAE